MTQFFRGLSSNNTVEIERIGMENPVDELVRILERVKKRKAEWSFNYNNICKILNLYQKKGFFQYNEKFFVLKK